MKIGLHNRRWLVFEPGTRELFYAFITEVTVKGMVKSVAFLDVILYCWKPGGRISNDLLTSIKPKNLYQISSFAKFNSLFSFFVRMSLRHQSTLQQESMFSTGCP